MNAFWIEWKTDFDVRNNILKSICLINTFCYLKFFPWNISGHMERMLSPSFWFNTLENVPN